MYGCVPARPWLSVWVHGHRARDCACKRDPGCMSGSMGTGRVSARVSATLGVCLGAWGTGRMSARPWVRGESSPADGEALDAQVLAAVPHAGLQVRHELQDGALVDDAA